MMSNNSDMTGGGVQLTLAPMRKLSAVLLLLAGLAACAVDPHKVADHTIYADEEERLTHDGALRFAVVGNLRGKVPVQDALAKRAAHDGVTEALVNDLRDNVDRKGLDFVALMGLATGIATFGLIGNSPAVIIGAIAGLYPAIRAARMSPTEALRTG